MESKTVLKGSFLAVFAIFAVVAFVGQLDEWSHSVTDEFVVYGQSSIPGGTTSVVKVIPTIVAGSLDGNISQYSTLIQIANNSSSAVTFQAAFFENGAATTFTLHSTHTGALDITGTTPTLTLPAQGVVAITASTPSTFRGLWGQITSSAALTVTTVFDQRTTATGALIGRVGIAASDADMTQFVIPRIRHTSNGLDTGFALVNTSSTASTSVTGTLRDSLGAVVATRTRLLTARESVTQFVSEFFTTPLNDPTGTSHFSVTFACTPGTCAAAGLSVEGTTLSSLPITRIQ
jgi:hypothetical protein